MTALPLGFLSGSPGAGELILVFVAVLILFGPKRLPEIARMLGKAMHDLRRASDDFHDQIMQLDAGEEREEPESAGGQSRHAPVEADVINEEEAGDASAAENGPRADGGGEDHPDVLAG